ncbi:transglutaminase TgpA family protein [Congregibacter sp.]|uniref:transglutaminase TgpA family protein n=1 Tax=Congregibacter sp. TaxID=2744308 RepID=UPI003F6D6513
MKQSEQLPRPALLWIIVAQALLLLPHLPRLPLWVAAVYLLAFIWRVQAFRGRVELPGRWLKVVLAIAAAGGIVLSYGSLLGMEPMVAFLLTAFALKLTEMRSRKDAYVVIFLGYFVCLTEFLFTQDLLIVAYSLVLVWILTSALVSVHRPAGRLRDFQPLRTAGVMLLQSVPLMLVLFFLFPRIGPLWSVPMKSHTAQTGMSDRLRPGDVSNLSQSDAVAFRAEFDGEIPPASELYWRGIVLSALEEGTWRSLRYFEIPAEERRAPTASTDGDPLRYSIIMAPTQQNWLFALRYARTQKPEVMELHDYRLYSPVIIENEYQYSVQSWPDATLQNMLSDWRRDKETALPLEDNPETRALAASLYAEAGSTSAFVDAVLAYFRNQSFFYTLQPPLLGNDDAMDEFLFASRRGFCEHYAYAFAVMMRSVGIPTRIVGGYLGGEVNPVNRTVIVHQFDAHAWNEVWLEGRGWVRVDPTAAVSPDRILYGLERAVAAEGSFLSESPLSPLRYRGVNWVNSLRLRYDALTYRWQSWVTGFDGQAQFDLLRVVLGEISVSRSLGVLLGCGALTMALVSLFLFRGARPAPRPVFEEELLRFQRALWRRGLPEQPGETPAQLTERAAERWPAQAESLRSLYRLLALCVYGPAAESQDRERLRRELRKRIRGIQFSL